LDVVNRHAAGIDGAATAHYVAVPDGSDPRPVRRFAASTADLEAVADGPQAGGVTTGALGSTGAFWVPLVAVLEGRGFAVRLVDPRQVHQTPGRPKGDVPDCQGRQRLHTVGLWAGACRPPEQVGVLRSYRRQRAMLPTYAAQHSQHRPKALTQRDRKLQHVVRDITGVTGLAISRALPGGQRDPVELAKLRDQRCGHSAAEVARALQGSWRPEHRFALAQAVALDGVYRRRVAACDREIAKHLRTFADRSGGAAVPPKARRGRRGGNRAAFDVRGALYRAAGVDRTVIEGIEEATALALLSEIGTDRSRWPSVKHLCSWLGLCPTHRTSGGKVLARRTEPCARRAALARRLAANGLPRRQSARGAFRRRLQARVGAPKAITATAHELARLVSSLRKHGTAYVTPGMAGYEQRYRERVLRDLSRRAKELGCELVQRTGPAGETALA
jgi:transposase